MKKLLVRTETPELENIRDIIQTIEMPVNSFSNEIIGRLEAGAIKKNKSPFMKKAAIATFSAATVGVFVIGSSFFSPVMAESLKKIGVVNSIFKLAGDMGLRTADEKGLATKVNQSDTHDGITLSIPEVINDGTRFAMAVYRDAPNMTSYLNGMKVNEDGTATSESESAKGTIQQVELLFNGKPLHATNDTLARRIKPVIAPGADKNSAILMFSDLSNNGLGDSALPNDFDITIRLTLSKVKEPFNIKIPVKKNTKDNIVLSTAMTKEFEHLRITLEKAELTPITTRLAIAVDGTSEDIPKKYRADKGLVNKTNLQSKFPGLDYDLIDDQGNPVGKVSGFGHDEIREGYAYYDLTYEPFKEIPKSITLKPYIYVLKDKSKSSGEFLYDNNGQPVKAYIKELEMTIPILK
ncbi:DUF4179 domain-containing protein [Brevibacillus formosus]|uniref:DUF4179 domain-containing protein n=1 Tax=Brevibacillus formosus TaxID=54913 RepID=A0A837KNL5_9BACL|nr:DUF4179 domain-containing protein [Brevibacillus formosus]KLH99104.1 hypothetical protein AA984_11330 [Brevibacillus formosus]MED1956496.1 DUF4179 domain-containing protein [Brevibacillus formosus]PSJ98132.1 DUF4179 domain-containing protein [Brevibacillus formosus]GED56885.1 hypothetical protein BFO01nite_10170 [Brevibacillus formosus]